MAKNTYQKVMLVNEEVETPTKYITKVPTKGTKQAVKLRLKKYDPVLKRHCYFSQKKLPNPKTR
jgi:ribosomal protein L33